jgi:hypothetical protein
MTPNEIDALAWLARRMEWEATVEELHARNAKHAMRAERTGQPTAEPAAPRPRWFARGRRTSPVRGISPTGAVATMQQ